MREVNIEVIRGNNSALIKCSLDESILNALLRQGYYMSVVCGGRGTCGKCKIRVIKGNVNISPEDEKFFTIEELEKGYRLACKAYTTEDCVLEIVSSDESDFEVITNVYAKESLQSQQGVSSKESLQSQQEEAYGFAVDIGTTTIAVSLVGLTSKSVLHTYTCVNRQRAYGADVISRIDASNKGKGPLLQESIRIDLVNSFRQLSKELGIENKQVKKIAISGNTTMGHLLMGYSCESLGVHPFTPVNVGTIEVAFSDVFETDEFDSLVTLMPGISTFVGGDVVSGLVVCDFDKKDAPCMLIDLGTNGEMAIGTKEQIMVSSTAAGPAFEGGNIAYGVGSIPGAISNVVIGSDPADEAGEFYTYKDLRLKTIGNKPPIGICGTGVVDITSELLRNDIVDESGLLEDDYFDEGYPIYSFNKEDEESETKPISFTQKDIREIQLAKAAIRSGMDTLLLRYGITYDDLDTIYLAGGFGYKIDVAKAAYIGLLPKEVIGKIKAIGNSSLNGAVKYMTDDKGKERFEKVVTMSKELSLSEDKDFYTMYVDNMMFDIE